MVPGSSPGGPTIKSSYNNCFIRKGACNLGTLCPERCCDDHYPGRVVPEFDQPFLRELIHPPFRIVYRREPKRIRVVRVRRSERLLCLPADEPDQP